MENVLLFLTPKSAVAYLEEDFTLRQTIEKMKFHRYSSVPIIDKNGKYVGTITEGDIFWYLFGKQTPIRETMLQQKSKALDETLMSEKNRFHWLDSGQITAVSHHPVQPLSWNDLESLYQNNNNLPD